MLLGLGQGDGDVLDRSGQARRRPVVPMLLREPGAEQLVNLLLCEAQSVEHHVDIVGQPQHLDAAAQSAQGERVTGERSSGALAT